MVSKTLAWNSLLNPLGKPGAWPGPKYSGAQVPSAGFSSLMKKPRYFTAGVPWVWRPGSTYSSSWRRGGTSSQKCQGDTPICRVVS